MSHCFTYGTLMNSEIMFKLLGKLPPAEPALLQNYRAVKLKGQVFPGLLACKDAKTHGLVYKNLQPQDWRVLDEFEGDWYIKQEVSILVGNQGQSTQQIAMVYLLAPCARHLALDEDWDNAWFTKHEARNFITSTC